MAATAAAAAAVAKWLIFKLSNASKRLANFDEFVEQHQLLFSLNTRNGRDRQSVRYYSDWNGEDNKWEAESVEAPMKEAVREAVEART